MPLCHLPIRSLLRSRSCPLRFRYPQCQPTWHQAPPSYSTASEASLRDDIGTTDPESEYLDFVIGDTSPLKQATDGRSLQLDTSREHKAKDTLLNVSESDTLALEVKKAPTLGGVNARRPGRKWKASWRESSRTLSKSDGKHRVANPFQTSGVATARSKESNAPATPREFGTRVRRGKQRNAQQPRAKTLSFKARRRRAFEILERKRTASTVRSANTNLRYFRQQHGRIWSKSISLRSSHQPYSAFSNRWNRIFAMISSRYDRGIPRQLRQDLTVDFSRDSASLAKRTLRSIRDGATDVFSSLREPHLGEYLQLKRWQKIALWLMWHEPEEMLSFLKATHVAPYPPASFIQDCLQYLAWHFTQPENISQDQISALVDTIPLLANRGDGERLHLKDTFCVDLIPHCSEDQVHQLYRTVKENNIQHRWQTWLHFATYFSKRLRLEEALDAILQAKNTGANLDKMPFLSNCSSLLRTAIRQPEGFRVCLRIIDNLVDMGVKLNTQLCNIIMLNAVESNDLKTAFDVYSSLTQHNLKPDMYTFAILLKGCKLSIDDADTLNSTIRDAIEHVQVLQQPLVASEILHCLALHHTKHHPESAFDTVADAFAQMYDLDALQRLGIPFSNLSKPGQPASQKMQPAPQPVHILLSVYLDNLSFRNGSTQPAYEIYQRFRALADTGVEPFASMLHQDYAFNAFLSAFTQTRRGLLHAAELVKDMQRSQSILSARTCAPTVRTWTIFLNGFTKHGQMQLAEQVLNYMTRQGIKPDQTTWNTLAAGYAGRRDIDGALDVLRRMEADGSVWDAFTLRGSRRATDQQRLMAGAARRRRAANLDFTADLQEALAAKLSTADSAGGSVEEEAEKASYTPLPPHPNST